MADAAPPERQTPPRRLWPVGLSARLLVLTAGIAALASLLILPGNLADAENAWLFDRLRAAELASLIDETAPNGVDARVANQLLANAGVVSVALQTDNERRLILQAPRFTGPPRLLDLTRAQAWSQPLEVMLAPPRAMLRVKARPRFRTGDFIEIVLPEDPLRAELTGALTRFLGAAVFTSVIAGAVVFFSLSFLLVRPMQRLTSAMERFGADPNDPTAEIRPTGRADEIGRAEAELARMQAEVRTALSTRARLAALGVAVAKINHDLRNMLNNAQLASERLAGSSDPLVAQALPRLEKALDRAIRLTTNVLGFGGGAEPEPEKTSLALAEALAAAADDAGLSPSGVRLVSEIGPEERINADPDQLHRLLTNLLRNARQAVETQTGRETPGMVIATMSREPGWVRLALEDDGPGLPAKVQSHLFEPFAGGARPGGVGLGLSIARELARGHGGDLKLLRSDDAGTVFELSLPD
jgi:signal transduction histidine kinase